MPTFRTKPVTVEAIQYDGTTEAQHQLAAAFGGEPLRSTPVAGPFFIRTLLGPVRVDPGDWMVRGASGMLFPVSDELFRELYEPAAPDRTDDRDRYRAALEHLNTTGLGGIPVQSVVQQALNNPQQNTPSPEE